MKELGVGRSALHKIAVKELHNRRQKSSLHLIWGVNMAKSVKISDVHYQMLLDVGKRWRMKPDELVEELVQETYATKAKRIKWKEH